MPRILNPVALCVSQIDELCKDPGLKAYVDSQFGGADQCRKAILSDFFRHAFDGEARRVVMMRLCDDALMPARVIYCISNPFC